MAGGILDNAEFENQLDDMKAKGTLDKFTAREMFKLNQKVGQLPCVSDECPLPKTRSRIKPQLVAGGTGAGVATIIWAICDFVTKMWFK
jgi:hypothetical protein